MDQRREWKCGVCEEAFTQIIATGALPLPPPNGGLLKRDWVHKGVKYWEKVRENSLPPTLQFQSNNGKKFQFSLFSGGAEWNVSPEWNATSEKFPKEGGNEWGKWGRWWRPYLHSWLEAVKRRVKTESGWRWERDVIRLCSSTEEGGRRRKKKMKDFSSLSFGRKSFRWQLGEVTNQKIHCKTCSHLTDWIPPTCGRPPKTFLFVPWHRYVTLPATWLAPR